MKSPSSSLARSTNTDRQQNPPTLMDEVHHLRNLENIDFLEEQSQSPDSTGMWKCRHLIEDAVAKFDNHSAIPTVDQVNSLLAQATDLGLSVEALHLATLAMRQLPGSARIDSKELASLLEASFSHESIRRYFGEQPIAVVRAEFVTAALENHMLDRNSQSAIDKTINAIHWDKAPLAVSRLINAALLVRDIQIDRTVVEATFHNLYKRAGAAASFEYIDKVLASYKIQLSPQFLVWGFHEAKKHRAFHVSLRIAHEISKGNVDKSDSTYLSELKYRGDFRATLRAVIAEFQTNPSPETPVSMGRMIVRVKNYWNLGTEVTHVGKRPQPSSPLAGFTRQRQNQHESPRDN
ncbi:MAG: hypothetical protein KDD62_07310 [Bdellovibrionales bacterium]|nr:hypothetical protein [Bdellovibrionales bacterium]